MRKGSLTIVGTGYRIASQMTPEAVAHARSADRLFYLTDEFTEVWLKKMNAAGETLRDCYKPGQDRSYAYRRMIERMLVPVRQGFKVCTAFYGHPGVFVDAAHGAIQKARREGFEARMLPGISANDCLIADLGVDPAYGCQSFEATDFLIRKRKIDVSCGLILWQIALIGEWGYKRRHDNWNPSGLRILVEVLEKMYGPRHKVVLYEASLDPGYDPVIERLALRRLPDYDITLRSTLYVPPRREAPWNMKMFARLTRTNSR